MRLKGSLTIAMSLMLSVLLVMLSACVRLAQVQCGRVQAAHAADTGMYSVFAEYDRDMLEDYDLYFLDGGYGGSSLDAWRIAEQMEHSMDTALTNGLTRCNTVSCSLTGYRLATDDQGKAFRIQAARAVKNTLGSQVIGSLREFLRQSSRITEGQQEKKDAGAPAMPETEADTSSFPESDMTPDKNPLEVIKRIRAMGILGLVLPADAAISEKEADASGFTSNRSLQQGMGNLTGRNESPGDKVFLQAYAMERLSRYGKSSHTGSLDYQAEYLIGGKSSDKENLKKTVNRLLLIREAANAAYLYTDPEKRAKSSAMALAVSTAVLLPGGAPAVEKLLLLGWAYVESLLDVRQLMLGGRVPLVKTASAWQSDLSSMGQILGLLQDDRVKSSSGLTYEEYLQMVLYTVSEKNLTFRCMDMIEQNIRTKEGRGNFRIDSCVESLAAEIVFEGPAGRRWTAERSYGYDM